MLEPSKYLLICCQRLEKFNAIMRAKYHNVRYLLDLYEPT